MTRADHTELAAPALAAERVDRRYAERSRGSDPARTILGLIAACALTSALACIACGQLIWNQTASMPLGLYLRTPGASVRRGDLVALRVPAMVRPLVHERRYLPDGSWLVKPVAATAGDLVCVQGGVLFINGDVFAPVLTRDAQGRPLPVYGGCSVLSAGQVFLASLHPRSFDSRSFGPVNLLALHGTVTPLWTF